VGQASGLNARKTSKAGRLSESRGTLGESLEIQLPNGAVKRWEEGNHEEGKDSEQRTRRGKNGREHHQHPRAFKKGQRSLPETHVRRNRGKKAKLLGLIRWSEPHSKGFKSQKTCKVKEENLSV